VQYEEFGKCRIESKPSAGNRTLDTGKQSSTFPARSSSSVASSEIGPGTWWRSGCRAWCCSEPGAGSRSCPWRVWIQRCTWTSKCTSGWPSKRRGRGPRRARTTWSDGPWPHWWRKCPTPPRFPDEKNLLPKFEDQEESISGYNQLIGPLSLW